MTNDIVKLTPDVEEQIRQMDNDTLSLFARKKASAILQRVSELSAKIEAAKEASKGAKGVKTGFLKFGNTKKKVDLTADALDKTNEAMANIAEIQHETILFTCISARFARAMCEAMSLMMANGLKDSNGNLHELDQNTQAFAHHIQSTAEDFARKQIENEAWQNQQDEELERQREKDEEHDLELERQRKKDDEHDRRLEDLDSRIEVMEKNEAHQSEQDEELERQRGKDKEHDLELERQRKKDDEHDSKLSSFEQRIKAMEASAVPAWIKALLFIQTIAIVYLLVKAFVK